MQRDWAESVFLITHAVDVGGGGAKEGGSVWNGVVYVKSTYDCDSQAIVSMCNGHRTTFVWLVVANWGLLYSTKNYPSICCLTTPMTDRLCEMRTSKWNVHVHMHSATCWYIIRRSIVCVNSSMLLSLGLKITARVQRLMPEEKPHTLPCTQIEHRRIFGIIESVNEFRIYAFVPFPHSMQTNTPMIIARNPILQTIQLYNIHIQHKLYCSTIRLENIFKWPGH